MTVAAGKGYVRLSAETSESLYDYGGKACGLIRLLRNGFPVPDAWVLKASTVPLDESDLPPELEADLTSLWAEIEAAHPGSGFAVRSSATAEDLDDASFAGVYTTVLNVRGWEALIAAVLQCRAALHTPQAVAYREVKGIQEEPRLAIVVQRMVESEMSGVLLTANPLRPFSREYVIDAAYGLGEAIVSGKAHPDHIVLDRDYGRILDEHIGGKEVEIRLSLGCTVEREVPEKLRTRRSLSDAQIQSLWKLGRDVEDRIGPRQDCEWAIENDRLFMLQQRPIVGLPPEQPASVLSRKFGDEYISDYCLPLSYTVLMPWISEVFLMDFARKFGFAERMQAYPTLRHEGYAYISSEFVIEMMSAVPRALRSSGSVDWFPPEWNEKIKAAPFRPGQLARMMMTAFRDPKSSVEKNPQFLEEHCRNVERLIKPKLSQDYAVLSDGDWDAQFQEALRLGDEHFYVIRWGMGFHNPLFHAFLRDALVKFCGDDGSLYRALISGLPGTKTALVNRRIWELAQVARKDHVLVALLQEGAAYPYLREPTDGSPFWPAFDAFLAEFGHRGATRDISLPRWAEAPGVVLGFVRAQLAGDVPDPEIAEAETARKREDAQREALQKARKGLTGAVKAAALEHLMKRTIEYTLYRENQRFHLDFLLYHIRKLVLEAARRMAARGVLAEPGDVFFLEKDEFVAARALAGPDAKLTEAILKRKLHYEQWRDRLPATYIFDGVESEGDIPRGAVYTDGRLTGLPASPGRAQGKVRVVASLHELADVKPGEILVANNTDPGWTSVFPLLGGLITCTGGILSHGALLAREYGIPAVTGVTGAMATLKTGDVVEVNAIEGWVKR